MSEESDDHPAEQPEDEQKRLWSIQPASRAGISIAAVIVVSTGLLFATVLGIDPCWETRMRYALYGEEPPKMSPWGMMCEHDAGFCECVETTGELRGGHECRLVEGELEASCTSRARMDSED